jgi:uncharacterized protein YpuA (DUF1002 family)
VVYGGDVSAADQRELASYFGTDQTDSTETVAREEQVDALQAQGISVSLSDQAISSIRLVCGETSGLHVETHNITRVAAPMYAAALLTAGLSDVSLQVAAPSDKPVSGDTALVGIFKAHPTCSARKPPDPERVRLAYEELRVTTALASGGADLTHASALILDLLYTVVTERTEDDRTLADAINSAALQQDVPLGDADRSELESLFRQMRHLNYGAYSRGYNIGRTMARVARPKFPDKESTDGCT